MVWRKWYDMGSGGGGGGEKLRGGHLGGMKGMGRILK